MLGIGAVIFASVGSMLPFDRLVRAVDDWAAANPAHAVFLQIGDGAYRPRHAPFARILSPAEHRRQLAACDLFVAHAGIGSILQAREERKQTLVLPRRHALGEHTTHHQAHTARRLGDLPGLRVATDEDGLHRHMSAMLYTPVAIGEAPSPTASAGLIAGVAGFLDAARGRR